MSREFKGNRKGLYRYASYNKEDQGNCRLSPEGNRDLIIQGAEKVEVLNDVFASVFTGERSSHIAQATEGKGRDWNNEELPTAEEDQVRDHL